ncbi:MAG: hypothetical protein ACREXJ_00215 [Gammaproteobacteria bacterium]
MPLTAPTTVTYSLDDPSAVAVPNTTVTARLMPATAVGDRNDDGAVVVGTATAITDAAGAFSISLIPNSAYRQAGTYYWVQVTGGPSYAIVVPVSAVPVDLWGLRVDPTTLEPAPPPAPTLYLLRSERAAVNGVASLGADGLVPVTQLPASGGGVPATRQVLTSTGLQGGGDLTADRTISPIYGAAAGTVCQGNDTRLSDARTPLAHAHVQGDVTGLVALLAELDARLDLLEGRGPVGYSPAMDGLVAVAADPLSFRAISTLGAAGWAVRMRVHAGQPITGALTTIDQAGTAATGGTNGFALYDDTGALVSSTVDDDTLWTATGKRTTAFPAAIAAQAADRYVYVALRVTGYSAQPVFDFADGSDLGARLDGLQSGKRRVLTLGGAAWAAIDPVAGPTGGGFMPFIALY